MSHPGDGGGFRAALDGDALRARDGTAADGHGVIGDGSGQLASEGSMALGKVQKAEDGRLEVPRVHALLLDAALAPSVQLALVSRVLALRQKLSREPFDALARRPDAPREDLAPAFLFDAPARPLALDAAAERCISRRQECPPGGDLQGLPLRGLDLAFLLARAHVARLCRHARQPIKLTPSGQT
jgi:hypothetical protein